MIEKHNMTKCLHCEQEISKEYRSCPFCGKEIALTKHGDLLDRSPQFVDIVTCSYMGDLKSRWGLHGCNLSGFTLLFALKDNDNHPTRSDGMIFLRFFENTGSGKSSRRSIRTEFQFEIKKEYFESFWINEKSPDRKLVCACRITSQKQELCWYSYEWSYVHLLVDLRFALPDGRALYARGVVR